MTVSAKSSFLIPEIITSAVRARFAQKNAFMGSEAAAAGLISINPFFNVSDPNQIGETVRVPYFGTLGSFASRSDGTPAVPTAFAGTSETGTIALASLAFEVTRWANNTGGYDVSPETQAADQVMQAAERYMDSSVITAAVAGGITKTYYSATNPRLLDYDAVVDAATLWGDESDPKAVLVVHSKVMADCLKLKDANGRPLLTTSEDGLVTRIAGRRIIQSDKCPLTGSTMSAVTAAGTTPPTVTLTGTPTGPWNLKVVCTTLGARGTSYIKFSTDGGSTYSTPVVTAATVTLTDTAVDSTVGNNGATGLTLAMADTAAAVDNVWTATATIKATSLLVRPGALAFWYNRNALELLTDKDILNDSSIGAMHLYSVAHAYRRHPQGTKRGVIAIVHNTSSVA
ncbi:MAG: phage major capsid protein [Bryobacteraceae bacterium]